MTLIRSKQVEFTGEAERDIGTEGNLKCGVFDPGYENPAICSFPAQQGAGLIKFPVP